MTSPVFVAAYHRLGPAPCGQQTLGVRADLPSGDAIKGEDLTRPDGGLVRFRDQAVCTACGARLVGPIPAPDGRAEVDV